MARGLMLLFIALAGSANLGGYPQDGSRLDAAATWLTATFVDGRAFPMFGLLFGYGVLLIVGAWAVFWKDRWVLAAAGVSTC